MSEPTIKLRVDAFDKACNARGWADEPSRIEGLGLPRTTLWMLCNGKRTPSAETVDTVVRRLGLPYTVLFERAEAA